MKHDCKRAWTIVILAVFAIGLTTCKKEKIDVPTVKVFEGAITIDITKASVSAEVTNQGGAEVKLRGFIYGIPGGNLDTVFCGSGTGVYSAELNNLQPNTTYVYESFAKNMGGIGVSGKVTFTTNPLPSYTIHVSTNPSNGGVVSGGGTVQQGQYCTVSAMANDGYSFTNWTENDNEVSTDATYTFIVNGDRNLNANFAVQLSNDYTIEVSANPIDGGIVSGGGTYQQGETCEVRAMAKNGYTFVNWTENNQVISGAGADYSFLVTGNRNLVANFEAQTPNSYAINVTAEPSNGGTVNGGGIYQQGETCEVRATATNGFTFVNWTENDQVISGVGADYTFVVTGNRNLVANFEAQPPNNYTINVSANPTDGGTVSGGGTYQQGQSCRVRAMANEGYTFKNWTENNQVISGAGYDYTFVVTGNCNLVANFEAQNPNIYTISISANPTDGGMVSGGGTYTYGQSCTVQASANNNYVFIHWTVNGAKVSNDPTFTFTVTDNRTLVAVFKRITPNNICANAFPICIEDGFGYTGGVNTGDGETGPEYGCLQTQKNPAWFFFRIDEPGDMDISIYSSRNPDIDFCCWGPFTDPISPCPNGLTENKIVSCSYSNLDLEHCLIPSTAQTGDYYFVVVTNYSNQLCNIHFSKVGGSGTSDCGFITPNYHTISVLAVPSFGGSVTGGGSYMFGQSCTLTAIPSTGFTFQKWTKNGIQVSTDASYTFPVMESATFVAHFQLATYTINASASPSSGGTVTGGGTFNYGQNCTLTAYANDGYTFLKWTKNGTQVSANATYTFPVTTSGSYVAYFDPNSYMISVSASPTNGGIVSGGGIHFHGQLCTVHATANGNYTFINWTENGNQVSTDANYTFTVNGNRTLVANFNHNGGGSVP